MDSWLWCSTCAVLGVDDDVGCTYRGCQHVSERTRSYCQCSVASLLNSSNCSLMHWTTVDSSMSATSSLTDQVNFACAFDQHNFIRVDHNWKYVLWFMHVELLRFRTKITLLYYTKACTDIYLFLLLMFVNRMLFYIYLYLSSGCQSTRHNHNHNS